MTDDLVLSLLLKGKLPTCWVDHMSSEICRFCVHLPSLPTLLGTPDSYAFAFHCPKSSQSSCKSAKVLAHSALCFVWDLPAAALSITLGMKCLLLISIAHRVLEFVSDSHVYSPAGIYIRSPNQSPILQCPLDYHFENKRIKL